MKKLLALAIILLSGIHLYAQLVIEITLTGDGKATINVTDKTVPVKPEDSATLGINDNQIIINNTFKQNRCKIIFAKTKGDSLFTFAFNGKETSGIKSDSTYGDSITTLKFNKGDKLGFSNGNRFVFSLPCEIRVIDANNKSIIVRTINAKEAAALGSSDITFTGIACYDALSLQENKESNILGDWGIWKILNYHDDQPKISVDKSEILEIADRYADNPFLSKDTVLDLISTNGVDPSGDEAGLNANISSALGLNVTTIAQGMAQFMIERAKEELNIAFFQKFKKLIDKNPEIQVFFPATERVLGDIYAYQYVQMLPALRVAFNEDIRKFAGHIDDLFELPKYRALLREFPEMRIGIQSLRIIQKLETESEHPAEIIKEFARLEEWKDQSTSRQFRNMGNAIKLAKVFSESLRYVELNENDKVDTAWITPAQLHQLVADKDAFMIYLGLVYEQVKKENIRFVNREGTEVRFTEIMTNFRRDIFLFENMLSEFIVLADKVEKIRRDIELKATGTTKPTPDDYYTYINTGIDVIAYGFDMIKHFDREVHSDDYIKIARTGNELYRNIYKEEYTSAILNGVEIITATIQLMSKAENIPVYKLETITALKGIGHGIHDSDIKRIEKFITDKSLRGVRSIKELKEISSIDDKTRKSLETVYAALKRMTVAQRRQVGETVVMSAEKLCAFILNQSELDRLQKLLPDLMKYGVFVAEMATAEKAEDVQAIIESAVLPAGSSSIKKNSRFNISLQSYAGMYYQPNPAAGNRTAWNDRAGIHAPIGLAMSWGMNCRKYNLGSVSVFLSVFDIGAIVDYQLKADSSGGSIPEVQKDYQIELGQIIAPGAYLVYGLPWNLPIAIGFGGQYGPGLGKIESAGNTILNNPAWRWNGFVSVDIPLVTLTNTRRK